MKSQVVTKPSIWPAKQEPVATEWQCVACSGRAILLHKGTTYCRECFDENSRLGRLVG